MNLLDHVPITLPDLDAAARSHDAVLAALGVPAVGRDEAANRVGAVCHRAPPR